MYEGMSPGQILEALAREQGFELLTQIGQDFQRREEWIQKAEAWMERADEREAILKSQPDRFYRWNHE